MGLYSWQHSTKIFTNGISSSLGKPLVVSKFIMSAIGDIIHRRYVTVSVNRFLISANKISFTTQGRFCFTVGYISPSFIPTAMNYIWKSKIYLKWLVHYKISVGSAIGETCMLLTKTLVLSDVFSNQIIVQCDKSILMFCSRIILNEKWII